MDIRAILVDTVAEWAAVTGRPPARTPDGISEACERLVAHPYRYLSALGALEQAKALLRATNAARCALGLTTTR